MRDKEQEEEFEDLRERREQKGEVDNSRQR